MENVTFIQQTHFKPTEIGELPKDWEVIKVIDFLDFERGTEVGSENYNKRGDGIRFIRVVDVSGSRDEILYTTSSNVRLCSENDVLITFDGSPGIVKRGLSGAYSSGIRKVIIKDDRITLDFISYVLTTPFVQKIIQKYSTGVTIKHASKSIPHIKIPLPPLDEQKAIAFVLSTIQEAKKTERVITAARELKKSMMKHLFTYGPVSLKEAEKVKLKETEIGMMPEEWEVVELKDIAENRNETVNPLKEDSIYIGLEHITPGEIKLSRFGYSNEVKSSKLKFYKDDILYAKLRPYLDKGAIAEFEGICSTDIIIIQPNKRLVNPQYLAYFMHIPKFKEFAIKSMTGVNHPRTHWSSLKNFKLPLPPLPIKQRIAEILSAIDEKIQAEEKKKQALENLFKSMLHYLMSGKIRIEGLED